MSDNAPEWIASLPEQLHDLPYLKDAESPDVFKERVVNAASWMGNSVRMPGDDASDEDRQEFRKRVLERDEGLMPVPVGDDLTGVFRKLGTPEKPEAYKTPEGVDLPPEALGQMKAMAHKANMTQGQFEQYLSEWNTANTAATTEAQNKQAEALQALKSEWGAAYDQRTTEIADFLKTNSSTPDSVLKSLQDGTLPAEQVRWLYSLADAVSTEDSQFHQQQPDTAGMVPPIEAEAQAEEINKRLLSESATMGKAERQSLMLKMLRLRYMADGQKPPSDGELLKIIG